MKQHYMGEGTTKMAFFSSRTSLVVSNDFFWKVWIRLKNSRYADVSRNSLRSLPRVTKYDYFCWYLSSVEIANRCPRCFLHCMIIFVIALFNPFYRDCTIGHGGLIFNMGIPKRVWRHLHIEMVPRFHYAAVHSRYLAASFLQRAWKNAP